MARIVYFSGLTLNTHRFVQKLHWTDTYRIPLQGTPEAQTTPYILITPSYGSKKNQHVPPQVKKFLSDERTRELCLGVIGTGNVNFGEEFAAAGHIVAQKLGRPHLYSLELAGTTEDVAKVSEGLTLFLHGTQLEAA